MSCLWPVEASRHMESVAGVFWDTSVWRQVKACTSALARAVVQHGYRVCLGAGFGDLGMQVWELSALLFALGCRTLPSVVVTHVRRS